MVVPLALDCIAVLSLSLHASFYSVPAHLCFLPKHDGAFIVSNIIISRLYRKTIIYIVAEKSALHCDVLESRDQSLAGPAHCSTFFLGRGVPAFPSPAQKTLHQKIITQCKTIEAVEDFVGQRWGFV